MRRLELLLMLGVFGAFPNVVAAQGTMRVPRLPSNNRVMLTASEGENVRSGIMVTVPVPTFRPMLASSATQLPKGAGWSYEVKRDGYRTLAIKDGPRIKLLSRNLRDATRRYPTVAREVARLRVEFVMFDGEVGRYSRLPT